MALDAEKFNRWQAKQIDVAINKYERRFYRHINSLGDDIEYYLKDLRRIDNASKAKIDSIIAQIISVQHTRYADAVADFLEDAELLALYASKTEAVGLGVKEAVNTMDKARKTPLAANGLILDEHISNMLAYNDKRLSDTIRFGWANKYAVDELSAVIVGTEKVGYADGLIHKQKATARSVIDTACHHVGQVSKGEVWVQNDVYRYRILATLDDRTTPICQSLDGKVFEWGSRDARVPPFHYFCRTVIIPEIDKEFAFLDRGRTRTSMYGSVDANLTYSEWYAANKEQIEKDKAERKAKERRAAARRKKARERNNQ